jgi:hypothetical protein
MLSTLSRHKGMIHLSHRVDDEESRGRGEQRGAQNKDESGAFGGHRTGFAGENAA